MGDRGNIKVYPEFKDHAPVYLYTHHCGHALPKILRKALARNERWQDDSYLTRIIFCEMLAYAYRPNPVESLSDSLSLGIASYLMDNEHPILGVHCDTQEVTLETEDGEEIFRISFEEFLAGKYDKGFFRIKGFTNDDAEGYFSFDDLSKK